MKSGDKVQLSQWGEETTGTVIAVLVNDLNYVVDVKSRWGNHYFRRTPTGWIHVARNRKSGSWTDIKALVSDHLLKMKVLKGAS